LRVGIIGCGAIARRGHLPAFKAIKNVEVDSVADIDKDTALRVSKEFNIPKYYLDYKEILNDPSIDLVSICTPTPTHCQIILEAAQSGKHILVEKPLCLTVEEGRKILKAVKENDVKLCVVKNFRYFPAVKKTLERIKRGYLGRLVSIQASALTPFPVVWTRATWLYHKLGVLADFAPHLIDLILLFADSEVTRVNAFGGDFLNTVDFINYAQIQMEFKNGTLATADLSWLTGTSISCINIHGTGGHIFLDVRNNYFYELHGIPTPIDDFKSFSQKFFKTVKGVLSKELLIGQLGFYFPLIKEFIKSIEENRKSPITPEEAFKVVQVLDAARLSLEKKSVIKVGDI